MKINVKKVALLSNVKLSSEEEKEFDGQLNEILTYIEKLNKLETSEITPTAQVTGLKNVTRNDKFTDDTLTQEEALSGSEKTHNGLFMVDKLVETGK